MKKLSLLSLGSPSSRWLSAVGLLGLALCGWPAAGQGIIGFSGQTQSSIVTKTQYVPAVKFDALQIATTKTALAPEPGFVTAVPTGGIGIDDATTLLSEYDDLELKAQSRATLGSWLVGIVSDGDFNKIITNATVPSAKSGSVGVDAVWMKPVYYTYTYYRFTAATAGQDVDARRKNAADQLMGEQVVRRPLVAFNTLITLFSGTPALSTGVAAGAKPTARTTLELQRAFGQSLLVPGGYINGNGLAFTSNATFYFGVLKPETWFVKNLGLIGSLTVVQTNWTTRDSTTTVNVAAPSLGFNYRLVEAHVKVGNQDNYVQVQPFVRYTMRYLFGDIDNYPRLLPDALGTDARTYHALDLGATLTINAVRLTANIPFFIGPHNIEGFSHGQPVLGFGLAASIRLTD